MSTAPAIVANGSIQSDTTQTHIRAFSKMTPAPLSNTGKKQGSHHRAYSTARSAADDEITSTVRQVVKKYVKALDENWKEIHLASPSLKFRIVRDAMFATGRYVSNVELTNVFKVDHLIKLLGTDRAPNVFNPYDGRNEVEQLLSEKKKDRSLPPNITYSNTSIYKPRVQSPPVLRARMPSIVRATLTCK
ncbi:hypothetical protein BASA50_001035 [Batrachochytrium salamandrivorans]|uniref:Uncharacterized protein n=1 Tax=Batrachochytrium salamandrivorans TaxID=1357716 RepID=A0ABQ8ESH2_9FUNG|nr:hypothetical protein BASA50_001035 [Batrachochytrium salamandrivorans]KAJ1341745.1 hypothetical protein BSLG_003640 [Batrachochytrium salamandrivorans]